MIRLAAALLCALAAGCAAFDRPVAPQAVSIAVPVSCLPDPLPPRPAVFPDPELAVMDDRQFVFALRWNAQRLAEYAQELEAVLRACR